MNDRIISINKELTKLSTKYKTELFNIIWENLKEKWVSTQWKKRTIKSSRETKEKENSSREACAPRIRYKPLLTPATERNTRGSIK